ncbi:hypothetical protein [Streptomyces chrestomyceticus]|uniref:hypothetical protein n=1 Tax=Streptomyces chrestomyceticus TaxID=68185 RepID=UPI0033C37996
MSASAHGRAARSKVTRTSRTGQSAFTAPYFRKIFRSEGFRCTADVPVYLAAALEGLVAGVLGEAADGARPRTRIARSDLVGVLRGLKREQGHVQTPLAPDGDRHTSPQAPSRDAAPQENGGDGGDADEGGEASASDGDAFERHTVRILHRERPQAGLTLSALYLLHSFLKELINVLRREVKPFGPEASPKELAAAIRLTLNEPASSWMRDAGSAAVAARKG